MATNLRSCRLCASSALTIATAADEATVTAAVVCPECGATGPVVGGGDPGHVEHLWNQRFGVDQ